MAEKIQEQYRFANEARHIIDNINSELLMEVLSKSFTKALKATYTSKKHSIKNTRQFIVNMGKNVGEAIKHEINYLKYDSNEYIHNILPRIKNTSINIKDNVVEGIDIKIKAFKSLNISEQKDIIISGLLWTGTVLLAGGGADFEGGIPDIDIKVGGIGRHRHVFTHTIIIGLCVEFFIRLAINLLREGTEYLPEDRSRIWDFLEPLVNTIEKNENVLISGVWTGIAIHLLKDANLGSKRTKPYIGIPKEVSMKTHQNIFAGNSFLSFLFGGEIE